MPEMVFSACICCYTACVPDDIKVLCVNEGECLCLTQKWCISAGDSSLGMGKVLPDVTKFEMCAIALPCCRMGLKQPKVLVAGKQHCLCLKGAAAFPFNSDFVAGPTCAVCFIQCAPNMGIMKPATKGGAPAVEVTDAVCDEEIVRE
mmetsp:Transcript_7167/g.8549  ORF Transcript_7167/g.8549 Transcript_7167/m.8549 type:complete len:147 (+) Transcript_7167:80-520(+)